MTIAKISEVPVLKYENDIIQHTDKVIDYLDSKLSDNNLSSVDEEARIEVLECEVFTDKEIG